MTNICIVSEGSGDAERELDVDETILAVCMCVDRGVCRYIEEDEQKLEVVVEL